MDTFPHLQSTLHPRHQDISTIGKPIHYTTGPYAGRTIRSELQEYQKPDLGRKFAKRDRRPLDPPPVIRLRMWEVFDVGLPTQSERELHADEIDIQGLVAHVDLFPAPNPNTASSSAVPPQSNPLTTSIFGSSFVHAVHMLDMTGQPVVFFVFADLSVRLEGFFSLRYRYFDLFSTTDSNGVIPVAAELFSGIFTVYSTKEFPGLQASTPLTKHLSRWGVRVNLREGERRRKPAGGKDDDDDDDDEGDDEGGDGDDDDAGGGSSKRAVGKGSAPKAGGVGAGPSGRGRGSGKGPSTSSASHGGVTLSNPHQSNLSTSVPSESPSIPAAENIAEFGSGSTRPRQPSRTRTATATSTSSTAIGGDSTTSNTSRKKDSRANSESMEESHNSGFPSPTVVVPQTASNSGDSWSRPSQPATTAPPTGSTPLGDWSRRAGGDESPEDHVTPLRKRQRVSSGTYETIPDETHNGGPAGHGFPNRQGEMYSMGLGVPLNGGVSTSNGRMPPPISTSSASPTSTFSKTPHASNGPASAPPSSSYSYFSDPNMSAHDQYSRSRMTPQEPHQHSQYHPSPTFASPPSTYHYQQQPPQQQDRSYWHSSYPPSSPASHQAPQVQPQAQSNPNPYGLRRR